ncbi:MAG: cupin domain-containing protein [Candidatus Thorarchaeota archaeon]
MFKGTYSMHKHSNEDELFYLIRGDIVIKIKNQHEKIALNQGDVIVIPKVVEDSLTSELESYVLRFEFSSLKSSLG